MNSDRLPRRITWIVILTAVLTASLFLVGLFNFFSILLIVGIVVQLRLPRLGRWLTWLGAAQLSILVFGIDILSLEHATPYHELGERVLSLALIASTCALAWCDTELVIEAAKRFRNRQRPYQPLNIYEWIFVILLNLSALLGAIVAVQGYHVSGSLSTGVTYWAWLLLIVVSDFSIIKNLRVNHA